MGTTIIMSIYTTDDFGNAAMKVSGIATGNTTSPYGVDEFGNAVMRIVVAKTKENNAESIYTIDKDGNCAVRVVISNV